MSTSQTVTNPVCSVSKRLLMDCLSLWARCSLLNKLSFYLDYIKHKHLLKYAPLLYKKVNGKYKYTVISAVYNVEKYLDDYFTSLKNQTLYFKDHIFIIIVDDGSTDCSAKIIKKWKKKYPDNITYIKKENAGQASARNIGLEHVKTEWITFIDPDDFVDFRYFEEVEKFQKINEDKNFGMLACNFVFYYEDNKLFLDTHPLKYRFKNGNSIVTSMDMDGKIQLSAATAFFKNSIIKKRNLQFDINIKPNFEDAHFVSSYIFLKEKINVGFIKYAKYFYRKRMDGNSTLDNVWKNSGAFDDVLRNGCLDLLISANEEKGLTSIDLQNTILYHIIWHFKHIVNNQSKVSFLTDKQIKLYKTLLNKIFIYIDIDTILNFNMAKVWFYHKVALLGMFKKTEPSFQIAYIDGYHKDCKQIRVRYFSYYKSNSICTKNNKEIKPDCLKIRKHDFLGDLFVNEYILWITLTESSIFNMTIDNKPTRIVLSGKQYEDSVSMRQIEISFD